MRRRPSPEAGRLRRRGAEGRRIIAPPLPARPSTPGRPRESIPGESPVGSPNWCTVCHRTGPHAPVCRAKSARFGAISNPFRACFRGARRRPVRPAPGRTWRRSPAGLPAAERPPEAIPQESQARSAGPDHRRNQRRIKTSSWCKSPLGYRPETRAVRGRFATPEAVAKSPPLRGGKAGPGHCSRRPRSWPRGGQFCWGPAKCETTAPRARELPNPFGGGVPPPVVPSVRARRLIRPAGASAAGVDRAGTSGHWSGPGRGRQARGVG
jgi:hypothetical protein